MKTVSDTEKGRQVLQFVYQAFIALGTILLIGGTMYLFGGTRTHDHLEQVLLVISGVVVLVIGVVMVAIPAYRLHYGIYPPIKNRMVTAYYPNLEFHKRLVFGASLFLFVAMVYALAKTILST